MNGMDIDVNALEVDIREVLRYSGYSLDTLPEDTEDVTQMISRCRSVSRPQYTYACFQYDDERGIIKAGSDIVLPGEHIRRFLKGSKECIVLAATLGMNVDIEANRIKAESFLKSIYFDGAGSALIEAVMEELQSRLEEEYAKKGMKVRGRFSPGYGDMPLEFQQTVEQLCNMQKYAGIVLNDQNMMTPMKSVTAFLGAM